MSPHRFTTTKSSYPDLFYNGNKFLIDINMRIFYHHGDFCENQNKHA